MIAMTRKQLSAFSIRLKTACDQSPDVPPFGQGRQVYISLKLGVTQEAVRKWFTGEARPRPEKMRQLALLLEVDEAWLALGIKPELDRRERRAYQGRTEGGIFVMFGLFHLAGGNCAFPGKDDPRKGYVDFYSILNGLQLAIHVSIGRRVSDVHYHIMVPAEYRDVRCIGMVHLEGIRYHILDLSNSLIDKHRQRKAGDYLLAVNRRGDEYFTGSDEWTRITDIGELT